MTFPTIDAGVLERARRGSRDAHAELYRAFAPMVYTLAFRMLGSKAVAEDVVQDSFVEVIRKAGQYRGDAAIGHWIKRIAINKCLSHLRSPWVVRRAESETEPPAVSGRGNGVERSLTDAVALERALAALTPTARVVVWVHDVEGFTHQEIGQLMKRTTSFSKSQLARAYQELRATLEPDESNRETEPCLGVLKTV
ncbi:MAG: RNA polymerase sigma factor [Gammaproteobacteria bacterium]|nr:RNA polymerase sigma factor [Gammaproteobacteria bacterium]